MQPPNPFTMRPIPSADATLISAAIDSALRRPERAAPHAGERPAAIAVPRSARFLYELGRTCAAMGDHKAATGALREAVALKPAMTEAWQSLAALLEQVGDRTGAAEATIQAASLDAAPGRHAKPPADAKIDAARQQLAQKLAAGPPADAGGFLRRHLTNAPTDVAALCLLAEIGARGKHYRAAERLLERALELAPLYGAARHEYAAALQAQGKNVQAIPHLKWLLAQDARNVQYRTLMAVSLADVGDYDSATAFYTGLSGEAAKKPKLLLNAAHALTYTGRRAEAVASYRKCIAMAPAMGDAWWSLANLKNERFTDTDLQAMQNYLARDGMPRHGCISVHYALGRALEQAGDYAGSFSHYASGAALKRAGSTYDAAAWSAEMQEFAAFFSAGRLADMAGSGCADAAPIFILGMPRAGSTLIEQILASHSAVEGTQELPEIGHIVSDISSPFTADPDCRFPRRLATMPPVALADLGRRFIQRSVAYRRSAKPYFIDKMPTNWSYIGLIHLILPNAKIIDARRAPMPSCFSAFKQLFGYGADYSYDLDDLGRYYTDYTALMAHFDRALPGRIHRVHYESMVQETETEIRRLLDYCGLPFEPGCLRFWESTRAVSTASSEQVRQPIFRDGLDQWRNYEPWLAPLKASLQHEAAAS